MPITIRCSACEKQFRVADEKQGKRLKCKCGEPISVPATSAQANPTPTAKSAAKPIKKAKPQTKTNTKGKQETSSDTTGPVVAAPSESIAARRSNKASRSNRSTAVIVIASALSAAVAFAGYVVYDRTQTPAIAKPRAPRLRQESTAAKPAKPTSVADSTTSSDEPQTWLDVESDVTQHEVTALDFMTLLLPAGEPLLANLDLTDEQRQQLDVLRREQAEVLQTDAERLQSRVAIDPQNAADLERQWRNHSFHYGNRVAKVLRPEQTEKLQAAIRAEQIPRFGDESLTNELAQLYYKLTGTSPDANQP